MGRLNKHLVILLLSVVFAAVPFVIVLSTAGNDPLMVHPLRWRIVGAFDYLPSRAGALVGFYTSPYDEYIRAGGAIYRPETIKNHPISYLAFPFAFWFFVFFLAVSALSAWIRARRLAQEPEPEKSARPAENGGGWIRGLAGGVSRARSYVSFPEVDEWALGPQKTKGQASAPPSAYVRVRRRGRQMSRQVMSVLLVLGIIALLTAYFLTVGNLPTRIYTPAQKEVIERSAKMSIAQAAPTISVFSSALEQPGSFQPAYARIPASETHVQANLKTRYEEQEGVSVTVYDLDFQGRYRLADSFASAAGIELFFPFPPNLETLHDVRFLVDGAEPAGTNFTTQGIRWRSSLPASKAHQVEIRYKANGANGFSYGLTHEQRTDVDVVLAVAGLKGSSVPKNSLVATGRDPAVGGETFTWKYSGLIANRDIQLSLPARLSFSQRVARHQDDFKALARLAPFFVALFMACLAGLLTLKGVRFRVEGYLLAALGLALFYPVLTFTSGVMGIAPAAAVTLVAICGLQFVFLGLAVGWGATWRPLGLLLFVFLGLFSVGFLPPWPGLMLSSGGLVLLGTFMLAYARRPVAAELEASHLETMSLEEAMTGGAPAEAAEVAAVSPEGVAQKSKKPPTVEEESRHQAAQEAAAARPPVVYAHCIHCGRELEELYRFCPSCGHDAQAIRRCSHCDYRQYVAPEKEPVYCVQCGHEMAAGKKS